MYNEQILYTYIPLVSFLSQVYGPGCEIVLHDLTGPTPSIMDIKNNLTGRTIGTPITDFAQKIRDTKDYLHQDFIVNYNGTSKGRKFLSSTYFIKHNNKLIGLLCINKDISHSENLVSAVYSLMQEHNLLIPSDLTIKENLENPMDQILSDLISDVIQEIHIPPERMSMNEKINLVQKLDAKGIFKIKGGMDEVALILKISKPTIYRYLNIKNT